MIKRKTQQESVVIAPRNIKTAELVIVGDSPLVVHRWSEKARKQIEDKQSQKANPGKREKRDPQAEYEAARYRIGKFDGIKAAAIKAAAVSACSHTEGLYKTIARGAFYIVGDLLKIEGPAPRMRTDEIRLKSGAADMRYRPEYFPWRIRCTVSYNAGVISLDQLVNLIDLAGYAVGICEGRPEKTPSLGWGLFHVATHKEMKKAA